MSEAIEIAVVLAAKDAASEVLGKVNEKFSGLGNAAKLAAGAVVAAAAAGTAIVGTLMELAGSASAAALEVRKLERETGLSAEAASELRYAGERLNISTDDLSKALGK